jgi:hypothetical protein
MYASLVRPVLLVYAHEAMKRKFTPPSDLSCGGLILFNFAAIIFIQPTHSGTLDCWYIASKRTNNRSWGGLEPCGRLAWSSTLSPHTPPPRGGCPSIQNHKFCRSKNPTAS